MWSTTRHSSTWGPRKCALHEAPAANAFGGGRSFQPGLYEVIVGRKIFERIEGMEIGRSFKLQRLDWKIAGVSDADGSGFVSEIWGDVNVTGPAFNRGCLPSCDKDV